MVSDNKDTSSFSSANELKPIISVNKIGPRNTFRADFGK